MKKNYDRVFGLLEKRIGTAYVRRSVIGALQLKAKANLTTHRSLLTLATSRDGMCRLVTTNFDRGFEIAAPTGTDID